MGYAARVFGELRGADGIKRDAAEDTAARGGGVVLVSLIIAAASCRVIFSDGPRGRWHRAVRACKRRIHEEEAVAVEWKRRNTAVVITHGATVAVHRTGHGQRHAGARRKPRHQSSVLLVCSHSVREPFGRI